MTSMQLAIQFQVYLDKMKGIMMKKNADYAGAGKDAFANFNAVEVLGICATETGFLTRMLDKLCRIATFAQRGVLQVDDESVEDTLIDLANYCVLLACYIKGKREGTAAEFRAAPRKRRR